MATRNKRKLAALKKVKCDELAGSNLAQNSNVPRSQEDYITQVSGKLEKRVIKRLSKEFSRTGYHILGALARPHDFLMNPLLQGRSEATPEASRNPLSTSRGANEDDSQNDPHPDAGLFHSQITQNSGPEEDHDMVTGVQKERACIAMTWQEITRKSHTAPLVHRQKSRKRTVLPVNRNSAARTPLRRLRQTKICWHFSS